MPGVLTAGLRGMARHAVVQYDLDHVYDLRKAGTVTGEDAEGYVTRATGATTLGLPCHYQDVSQMVPGDTGLTVLVRPLVKVAGDDPSYEGDQVLEIRDGDGNVLLEGPVMIENILDAAPGHGGPLSKVLTLRTEATLPR